MEVDDSISETGKYVLFYMNVIIHIHCTKFPPCSIVFIDPLSLEVPMMTFETRLDIMEKTQREIVHALLILQKNQKLILANPSLKTQGPLLQTSLTPQLPTSPILGPRPPLLLSPWTPSLPLHTLCQTFPLVK